MGEVVQLAMAEATSNGTKMKRIYADGVRDDAKYFVALEVEQTPAFELQTLFLVGLDNPEEIIRRVVETNSKNVYFGTGTSFKPQSEEEVVEWDRIITEVLDQGYYATLDFDMWFAEAVHGMKCSKHKNFIPMISVKLHSVMAFNKNATLKIDDVDFDATNPGVWCWKLTDLLDKNKMTHWAEYKNDTIIP